MRRPREWPGCEEAARSQGGARIAYDKPAEIPDEFLLFLRNVESMRRHCVVVRREQRVIGVRFRYR